MISKMLGQNQNTRKLVTLLKTVRTTPKLEVWNLDCLENNNNLRISE